MNELNVVINYFNILLCIGIGIFFGIVIIVAYLVAIHHEIRRLNARVTNWTKLIKGYFSLQKKVE